MSVPSLPVWQGAAVALFYVSNWVQLAGVAVGPLSHPWSLAIEEQFYVLWPLLLIVAAPALRARPWLLLAAAAGMALCSDLLLTRLPPSSLYFSTSTHAPGLLLGAWAALSPAAGRLFRSPRIVVAAAALLFALTVVGDLYQRWMVLAGYPAAAFCALALIVHVAGFRTRVTGICSWRPLVLLGRISYGFYLYHFPIALVVLSQVQGIDRWSAAGLKLAGLAVSVALAGLSFIVMERPLLGVKERWRSIVAGPQLGRSQLAPTRSEL